MFISIDEHTTLNADYPILYLEDVTTEKNEAFTRIVFGVVSATYDLITPTPRAEVVAKIEEALKPALPREMAAWLDEVPVYPAPTDTPLTQDQLPFEGEGPVDYLNRVTRDIRTGRLQ